MMFKIIKYIDKIKLESYAMMCRASTAGNDCVASKFPQGSKEYQYYLGRASAYRDMAKYFESKINDKEKKNRN